MFLNTEKQRAKQSQKYKDRIQEEVNKLKMQFVPGFCDSASNGRAGTDCLKKKIKQRNVKISATNQNFTGKSCKTKT